MAIKNDISFVYYDTSHFYYFSLGCFGVYRQIAFAI